MKRESGLCLLVILCLFTMGGCLASKGDLDYYQETFVQKADDSFTATENSKKVLGEVRAAAKKGMKRTEIMNAIDQGRTAIETMRDDFADSTVPQGMDRVKNELVEALTDRVTAYNELFAFYDAQSKAHEIKADQLLGQSDELMKKARVEIEKFRK